MLLNELPVRHHQRLHPLLPDRPRFPLLALVPPARQRRPPEPLLGLDPLVFAVVLRRRSDLAVGEEPERLVLQALLDADRVCGLVENVGEGLKKVRILKIGYKKNT